MANNNAISKSPQITLMAMMAPWLGVLISRYATGTMVLVELVDVYSPDASGRNAALLGYG